MTALVRIISTGQIVEARMCTVCPGSRDHAEMAPHWRYADWTALAPVNWPAYALRRKSGWRPQGERGQ